MLGTVLDQRTNIWHGFFGSRPCEAIPPDVGIQLVHLLASETEECNGGADAGDPADYQAEPITCTIPKPLRCPTTRGQLAYTALGRGCNDGRRHLPRWDRSMLACLGTLDTGRKVIVRALELIISAPKQPQDLIVVVLAIRRIVVACGANPGRKSFFWTVPRFHGSTH